MPKRPIWLDDASLEVLRGFLAEELDNKDTPTYIVDILQDVYNQTNERLGN